MIREREVRLIGEDGAQLGIRSAQEALELAQEAGLDLVEVAPQVKPPVCRIMDYGKYKYTQSKRQQEARKRQKTIQVKEVKLRPKTDEHDFQVKARRAREFLARGDKVKVTLRFRGREMVHKDLGRQRLDRLAEQLSDVGGVEGDVKQEGYLMVMHLVPKS
jgi:translation initiation factor IF-3